MGPLRQRCLLFGVTNPRDAAVSAAPWALGSFLALRGIGGFRGRARKCGLPLPEGLILSGSGGTPWRSALHAVNINVRLVQRWVNRAALSASGSSTAVPFPNSCGTRRDLARAGTAE